MEKKMNKTYDYSAFAPTDNPVCDWQTNTDPQVIIKTQPEQDLSEFVGKHIIYTYANGWHYEYYFRNETMGDYRISSGLVAGRWTTHQKLMVVNLGHGTFKVAWIEPTGSACCLDINFKERWLHGFFGMAQWIMKTPEVTAVHQNLHIPTMRENRDKGPLYPLFVNFDFAEITFMEDCGRDNDDVINCAPSDLPEGYLNRRN